MRKTLTVFLSLSQRLVRIRIARSCHHFKMYYNMMLSNLTVKEGMLPIAVYEAVWIPFTSAVVHMTLVEQVAAKSMKAYWLRIGAAIYQTSQPSNSDDSEGQSDSFPPDGRFQILATLSNEVGRLIIDQPDDWVELPAVRLFNIFYIIVITITAEILTAHLD